MWGTTPRRTPSTRRSRPTSRWASWWPTSSTPTRRASRGRRTPKPCRPTRNWSGSWSRACGANSSELQVLADVAELVDEHGATVEPPDALHPMKRVFVVPGHDHLQRQLRRRLRDAVVGPARRGALGLVDLELHIAGVVSGLRGAVLVDPDGHLIHLPHTCGSAEDRLRWTVLDAADAPVREQPGHPVHVAGIHEFRIAVNQVGDLAASIGHIARHPGIVADLSGVSVGLG